MKRRKTSWLLIVVMVLSVILGQIAPYTAERAKAASHTLIIHYGGRADNKYDGWNLWVWEEGKDGKQVDFTAEDSYGKIAVCNVSSAGKVGFILRLNEWEEKDVEEDRFVQVKDEVTEIWLTSGKKKIQTTAPAGAPTYNVEAENTARQQVYQNPSALKLNVHFYDFKKNYEQVEAVAWLGNQDGGTYQVQRQDTFGALFQIGLLNTNNAKTAGLQISMPDGQRDCQVDRRIDLTRAKNNVLDVYVVQGNSEVYYAEKDAVKDPVISEAAFVGGKEIVFSIADTMDTSKSDLVKSFQVKDQDGNEYELAKIWSENPGKVNTASIILKEAVDFSNSYTVYMDKHVSMPVSMKEAFSTEEFQKAFTYEGDDLGAVYTADSTKFRVWAPTASQVQVRFFEKGTGKNTIETASMQKDVNGTWIYEASGDRKNQYYTYLVTVDGVTKEAVDPHARTTGANGKRAMIVDLDSTDPEGFDGDTRPAFENPTDAVIYELQLRDLSVDDSSGIEHKGKFLGLTETGTKNEDGMATGLDHLADLGVTHVHLLPIFDFASVNETGKKKQYNWGYDPQNYNVPEGSYSTDPTDGNVRVNEMKQMVQSLHKENIRVVMDVVYNHTYNVEDSNFQKIVPNYYYRMDGDSYSNGSGCGNETASERSMMRKYIVDSVVYWATEYHIDGFRFDLMGVLDVETMNQIRQALDEIDPSIMIYGEGWTGGESTYDESLRAVKSNVSQMQGIAAFSDDFRDGLKGNVFDQKDTGFITGNKKYLEDVKLGIVGATKHEQIKTDKLTKAESAWASDPTQCVNYASCHDNLTLWDKIQVSAADAGKDEKRAMNKLAAAMTFTAQGIPFFQAGEEFLRTKPSAGKKGTYDENSYSSPDSTNSLKWDSLKKNEDVYEYYKGLIAFRKAHSGLRMTTAAQVQENLHFVDVKGDAVAYTIGNQDNQEISEEIMVIHNGNKKPITVTLPDEETWNVYVNKDSAGTEVLDSCTKEVTVEGISSMVLVKESKASHTVNTVHKIDSGIYIGAAIVIIILILIIIIYSNTGSRKEKKKDKWRERNVRYYK